jgi:hypothetical protein
MSRYVEEHLAAGSPEFYYIGSQSLVVNRGQCLKFALIADCNRFGETRLDVAGPAGVDFGIAKKGYVIEPRWFVRF